MDQHGGSPTGRPTLDGNCGVRFPITTITWWPTGSSPTSQVGGELTFSPLARARLPVEFQMASFLADRAEQFIDENSDRPFILYVSTFEPHSPYDGPFDDQYDPDNLPYGPAFLTRGRRAQPW